MIRYQAQLGPQPVTDSYLAGGLGAGGSGPGSGIGGISRCGLGLPELCDSRGGACPACIMEPKLALVDVNLKKELTCGLIEELHRQGILVIVVSGYAVPPMPAEMVAAFVQKPFSEANLITILHATVARLH